ncbi:hypothetical protein DFH07DRAFT_480708 [Mycena maculata]|uniref:Uncharacterized protein n=1 Tax=Mycena maculata TaxID=230809 RepID=A0AAD7J3S3_9AGAR|nr:hypothetical protein DFH07DRAFT_480708 [Mycena maculata]
MFPVVARRCGASLRLLSRVRLNSTAATPDPKPSTWKLRREFEVQQLELGGLPPPEPPSLDLVHRNLLGPAVSHAVKGWNKRPVKHKVIFYHVPTSRTSVNERHKIDHIFYNKIKHPAPHRFILDVREEIPPVEVFREYLHLTGTSSFGAYLSRSRTGHSVPNAFALYELVCLNPDLLLSPLVFLIAEKQETELYMGPRASLAIAKKLEKVRLMQLGPVNSKLLLQLCDPGSRSFKKASKK